MPAPPAATAAAAAAEPEPRLRLAKFLAAAGLASRRAAEGLITAGRVAVNGQVVATPACTVEPAHDRVTCDGQPVTLRPTTTVLMLHKPAGYTCSAHDPHAAKLALDLLPKEAGRLFSVGRLDRDSEGLLLFTNDGDLANRLTHPRFGIPKTYRLLARGRVTRQTCAAFQNGLEHDGEFLKAAEARILGPGPEPGTTELEIVLLEGRKREIRRLCSLQHLFVLRLQRLRFGPVALGALAAGAWRPLTDRELAALRRAGAAAAPQGAG